MQRMTVQIGGMTCGHCVDQVTKALETLKDVHVHSVQVGRASVSLDSHTISPGVIIQAIDALGYKARREPSSESKTKESVMSQDNSAHHHHPTQP